MQEALTALRAFYGPLAPPPRELFAFFVWEVISARLLPARRDLAWQALKRLPALTPDAMFRTAKADLEKALEMSSAREERIDALRNGSGHFRRHRDLAGAVAGPLRGAVAALREVPQLTAGGRTRALLFCGGHAVAGVDETVTRVVGRLHGLSAAKAAALRRRARAHVVAATAGNRDRMMELAVVFGHHALHACLEQAPHCHVCPLRDHCRHAQTVGPSAAS